MAIFVSLFHSCPLGEYEATSLVLRLLMLISYFQLLCISSDDNMNI
jgi:hypothetical protein